MVEARYKPYSAYKPSGLKWLGDIPTNWEVIQSRRMFAQRKERAQPDDEQLTASQKYGIIYQKEFMERENQRVVQVITGSEILKHVEADDFVISMRSFQGGLEWCKYPGCVSSAYIGLIPQKHVVSAFFSYLFKSKQYIQALQSTSNLVRDGQALRYENFSQVPLPIISQQEQTKIAAFLDYETGRIDGLIAKQERLIALLEEKRQAVISHAVTKGLNPTAPLRPSGIDWLGDVPAHWEVCRVKTVSTFMTSGPRGWSEKVGEDGAIFVQSGDLNEIMEVEFAKAKRVSVANDAETARTQLCDGDIVVCITGAKTGNVAVCNTVPEVAFINQHLALIRPAKNIAPLFLGFLLKSRGGQAYFEVTQYGLKQGLSLTDVNEAPVVLPPLSEQIEIVDFLDTKSSQFDALADQTQSAITLLKERRTTLISAAVTGKIDLRDWQARHAISNQDILQDASV